MMRSNRRTGLVAMTAVTAAVVCSGALAAPSQSEEKRNMRRVGHTDLQGRPAYQPNTIVYPDGRTIAFVGTHGGSKPNPLNGGKVEQNGVMVIDVTDPERPVEKSHIPVPVCRGPIAVGPHVPRLGSPKWGSGTRLHDAQRPGQQRGGLRGSGTSPMSVTRCKSVQCAACATHTSTGGNAKPASPTYRAAWAFHMVFRNGVRDSRC
jgi:hypothetical protein